jgi:hypothetical protein
LVTNLPRPGGPREEWSPWPAASLEEVVRIYGLRHWVEWSYMQVKDELGWASFQVRSDIAIRRHQAPCQLRIHVLLASRPAPAPVKLVRRAARNPQLAHPGDHAHALVAGLVHGTPAP